ncbi:transmembrane protein 273 isoform X1 [Bos javanicus]|uniref:transmembrane protein 273 isoform X1 n=1 Tax=Bos taurus TaxID=9913 RepID=UPI0028CB5BD0|nr:transmembrane protein 273 isoform X1 [Bos taurus]XP_061261643.1 transmembrane protein 273 isoform X1 [Bos javanicus]
MSSAVRMLTVLLLLDVGAAQVLATGKPARAEADIKYAVIGTAVGIAISAGFLALKFCMIRKHMFDNDSSDLRSTNVGFNETIALKKRTSRELSSASSQQSSSTEKEDTAQVSKADTRWSQAQSGSR